MGEGNITTDMWLVLAVKASIEISSNFSLCDQFHDRVRFCLEASARFSSQVSVMDQTSWNLPCGKTLRRKCRHGDWSHRKSHCRCYEVHSISAAHCQDSCWWRITGLQKNMRNAEKYFQYSEAGIQSIWVFHIFYWSNADNHSFLPEKNIIFGKFHVDKII